MRALMILTALFSFDAFSKSCREYDKVAEYMDTRRFVRASREHRAQGAEPTVSLGDVNQARVLAFRFPAFEELGFGRPGSPGWTRYQGRLERSALYGKNIGWEVRNDRGFARVRLDWDPQKGAHYNIEITERANGRTETHKLAVAFNCGQAACTQQQVAAMADRMQ